MDPTTATATAADICKWFKLTPEARALLRPELSPPQFFDMLMEKKLYADARRLLAHAMSKPRAVWWGCLCALEALGPELSERDSAALEAVSAWVIDPSELNRRAVEAAGWAAKPTTLTGCLAMAAFLSDGSMSRLGFPFVPTKPYLTGRLVGVTVYLASVRKNPAKYRDRLRQFLEMGLEIARGRNLWFDPDSASSPIPVAPAVLPMLVGGSDRPLSIDGCRGQSAAMAPPSGPSLRSDPATHAVNQD